MCFECSYLVRSSLLSLKRGLLYYAWLGFHFLLREGFSLILQRFDCVITKEMSPSSGLSGWIWRLLGRTRTNGQPIDPYEKRKCYRLNWLKINDVHLVQFDIRKSGFWLHIKGRPDPSPTMTSGSGSTHHQKSSVADFDVLGEGKLSRFCLMNYPGDHSLLTGYCILYRPGMHFKSRINFFSCHCNFTASLICHY